MDIPSLFLADLDGGIFPIRVIVEGRGLVGELGSWQLSRHVCMG